MDRNDTPHPALHINTERLKQLQKWAAIAPQSDEEDRYLIQELNNQLKDMVIKVLDPNLDAALEEQGTDAEETFLLALRNVATARGMQVLAEKSTLKRESLYRALSATGNSRLSTLGSILEALGLHLCVDVAVS